MKTASELSMTLLPRFPGLKLEDITIDAECVSLSIASTRRSASCPICENVSGRVHSHYERTVTDLPWGGRSVRLSLKVRRFRCPAFSCTRRIFAERLLSVVEPYATKTTPLREILLSVGFALGGEAGWRLAGRLGMRASPSTLLGGLHAATLPSFPPPEAIGVDDFALFFFPERRRHPPQASMLDPFAPYLAKRWEEACHVALQLWREIKEQGYPGAPGRILRWARQRRREPAPTTPGRYADSMRKKTSKNSKRLSRKPSRPLSSRRLAWMMVGEPEDLSSDEQDALQRAREACTQVAVIYPLVQGFASMVRSREDAGFEGWLEESISCGVKGFETFAIGLRREKPAVEAVFSLPPTATDKPKGRSTA